MSKNHIPQQLQNIAEYLISKNIELSKNFSDGRINAAINENEIIQLIQQKFLIEVPRSRAWYDFCITGIDEKTKKEYFYPVNIKVTDTTHADNLNCKLGIYYALTGLLPDFPNEIKWLSYFEKLKEHLNAKNKKDSDYYFLVVNKLNKSDVFLNSLKGLKTLQPNGNNLPFQCKWNANKEFVERSEGEATQFILSVFGQSIKLRSEIYFNFKKYFPEYV